VREGHGFAFKTDYECKAQMPWPAVAASAAARTAHARARELMKEEVEQE